MILKNTILLATITSVIILFSGCDSPTNRNYTPHVYECERPSDIPDTLATGEKVHWDCNWNMDYNAGNVKVIYNKDGSPKAIYRKLDKSWKHWGNDRSRETN
jgi:hypothetical protein